MPIRKPLALLTAAGAFLSSAAPAGAAVITETFSDNLAAVAAPVNLDFTLPQFNTGLGTLTSVTLTYTSSISPEIVVTGGGSGPFAGGFYNNISYTLPVNFTGPASYDATASGVAAYQSSAFVSVAGGSTVTIAPAPIVSSTNDFVNAADFAAFTGSGNDSYTFATGSPTRSEPYTGQLSFANSGTVSGEATVAYTYSTSTIPEPIGLASIGFAVHTLTRRRRK